MLLVGGPYLTPCGLSRLRKLGCRDMEPSRVVSDVIRTNEKQVWFVSEHLVGVPPVKTDRRS